MRKKINTWERGAGLGWVAIASGSVICPDIHFNRRKVLCNGHNFPVINIYAYRFTPSFGSMYEGRTCILGSGVQV
jgi:hypothetical protein